MDIKTIFDYKRCNFETLASLLEGPILANPKPLHLMVDTNALIANVCGNADVNLRFGDFCSALLNTACYFRHFFFNHGIRINAYFYCGINDIELEESFMSSAHKNIKEYITEELRVSRLLMDYIPGIYTVEGAGTPARLIPLILSSSAQDDNTSYKLVISSTQFSLLYNNVLKDAYVLSLAGSRSRLNTIYDKEDISFVSDEDILALSGSFSRPSYEGVGRMRLVGAKKFVVKHERIIKENNGRIPDDLIFEEFGSEGVAIWHRNRAFFSVETLIRDHWNAATESLFGNQLLDYTDKDRLAEIFHEEFSVVPVSMQQLFLGEEYEHTK
jgi:hypothetical protein